MSGSTSLPPVAEKFNAIPHQDGHDVPLTLTVHDLPSPSAPVLQRKVSGRLKMLAVLLVCAAPVLASYFTFYVVRPTAQRNYGALITPAPALPDIDVTSIEGQRSKLGALKAQWLLISVAGGACASACEKHIYLQRQLRESLGREKDRLDRVWLIYDTQPVTPALVPQVNAQSAGAHALRVDANALQQWLTPEPGKTLNDHLYLVDPMGHWMMRFPADVDAAKAKRDIERLLRAANSWDRPGRDQEVILKVGRP